MLRIHKLKNVPVLKLIQCGTVPGKDDIVLGVFIVTQLSSNIKAHYSQEKLEEHSIYCRMTTYTDAHHHTIVLCVLRFVYFICKWKTFQVLFIYNTHCWMIMKCAMSHDKEICSIFCFKYTFIFFLQRSYIILYI